MESKYWLGRKRAAVGMARKASSAQARMIHYELAGRYSVRAAQGDPFMMPIKAPATEGERVALQPSPPRSRPPRGPRPVADPDGPQGEGR